MQRESAGDTLELCMRIFNKIGAEIHPYDIAHRVPSRNTSDGRPKPIIAAVSEPEANERGSFLISRRLHYRGLQSFFLTKHKGLWPSG